MNLKRLLPLLIVPLLLTACPSGANRTKNGPDLRNLPREIRSGEQGPFHVQGIAVDLERGYIYFSFTTKLLKMDFEGNLIGSVDGMTGHLGCLTMNPADGRVYGSLEYKDDAIGKGIRRTLDAGKVARMTDDDVERLMHFDGIVKNRLKIKATITNARLFLAVQEEFGSFRDYTLSFFPGGKPITNHFRSLNEIPASSPESDAMSRDMKKRGFKFFGPTICYAHLQASGFVNDHLTGCICRNGQ